MALYDYPKFKIRLAPDSKKRQGLRTGDVVRRQYADGEITCYSLMVVLDTGTDIVAGPDGRDLNSPYFIGALLEGDEPRDGELLDFVRMTSLTDQARSGAMYLTASDINSPYMDAIDGLGSEYSLLSSMFGWGVWVHRRKLRYVILRGQRKWCFPYFSPDQEQYK